MQRATGLSDAAQQGDVDLTPLLDVVFIMLIFFIVTASFLREQGIDVSSSEATKRPPTEASTILVTVDEGNRIWIDGRMIDPRAVRANIARLHAEDPKRQVVIDAHDHSANRVLVQVMDASRQAGVYDILIAET